MENILKLLSFILTILLIIFIICESLHIKLDYLVILFITLTAIYKIANDIAYHKQQRMNKINNLDTEIRKAKNNG